MGYEFDNGSQEITYGSHIALYQPLDLSIGFWIYFLSTVQDGQKLVTEEDSFPIIETTASRNLTYGLGVSAFHVKGGGFGFGVTCLPGQVDIRYKLNFNRWLYFGFSRDLSAASPAYYSYFGSRRALVDGPVGPITPGQFPFPITQPGQNLGPWVVGHQFVAGQQTGYIVGPAHYWSRVLTREEHLSMARCTLPANQSGLLWWTKMLEGAADVGPSAYANTFVGNPLYVPDDGCASFGAGDDYRLYNG